MTSRMFLILLCLFGIFVNTHTLNPQLINEVINGDFNSFEDQNAAGWLSVFGLTSEASIPDNHNLQADDNKDVESSNPTECKNCQGTEYTGHEEWQNTFGDETLSSPFQDGHYIYRVVPGYGSGSNSVPPILYVADLENPSNYNAVLTP